MIEKLKISEMTSEETRQNLTENAVILLENKTKAL